MVDDAHKVLKKLVEDVKNGKKIVLFPPGTVLFVFSNLLLLMSFVSLLVAVLGVNFQGYDVPQKATAQLIAVFFVFITIVPPALLLTRGKLIMRLWLLSLACCLTFLSLVLLMLGVINLSPDYMKYKLPLLFAVIGGALSVLIFRSKKYQQFGSFYYLLRRKE